MDEMSSPRSQKTMAQTQAEYREAVKKAEGRCQRCGRYPRLTTEPLVMRRVRGRDMLLCWECETRHKAAITANRTRKFKDSQISLPGVAV